jgi:hypothetical protein
MNPSHADTPSGPVKPNQPHVTAVSKPNSGGDTTRPIADDPVADGPLPDTGASAPVGKVAIGGAAAIALGAGVYAASGLGKPRREVTTEDSDA